MFQCLPHLFRFYTFSSTLRSATELLKARLEGQNNGVIVHANLNADGLAKLGASLIGQFIKVFPINCKRIQMAIVYFDNFVQDIKKGEK